MDTELTFIAMITVGRVREGRGGLNGVRVRMERTNGVGVRRPLTAPGPDQKLIPEENSRN
jgi:hypothetical protein